MELSERQKATLATALTVLSAVVILCAVAAVFWLLGLFVSRFSDVLLPLAVAGVIALVVKPFYDWQRERVGMHQVLALAGVFLVIALPLLLAGWFFGDLLVTQISDLASQAPQFWERSWDWIEERLPQVQQYWQAHKEELQAAVQEQSGSILSGLQLVGGTGLSALAGLFGFLGKMLGWVVLPVYVAFFLLMDPNMPKGWSAAALPFLKQETREDIAYLVSEFVEIMVAFFRGQLLIGLLQGLLYALGFHLVGLNYGAILGLMLGFLNIIPYLGSIVGLGIALPLALFQTDGGWGTLGLVLLVFTVVQMIEGYVLTPRIMGNQTGLHPMAIIVAVFFWGSALGGISGMMLAIPLTAFFVVFWRLAREKYIRELV